jgi:DNA invertase Pin-like site-specific DNA recombinase
VTGHHDDRPVRPGRAVVYCRVSTDEQGDSGLGLEAQEASCRRWAAYRGVAVVAVATDVCSGARPPAGRPGFAEALALLAAGEGDALVCAKLDRATRRQRGLLDLLDLAERHRFALVLLDVDLDTSTPIGRAILGILSVVAELEREQTRQRTRAALAAKRARGQRQGPGPLLDPELRRWIVEQVEGRGRSRKGVAAELNAAGAPTATGRGRWHPSTIAGVLASVAYERELAAARRGHQAPPPAAP